MKSLTNQLYEMLGDRNEWIHGAELEDYGRSLGYLGSNVGRRLRELRKCGSVMSELRLYGKVKTAWWKINTQSHQDFKGGRSVQSLDSSKRQLDMPEMQKEVRTPDQRPTLLPLLGQGTQIDAFRSEELRCAMLWVPSKMGDRKARRL